jgi:hypothetical protein
MRKITSTFAVLCACDMVFGDTLGKTSNPRADGAGVALDGFFSPRHRPDLSQAGQE